MCITSASCTGKHAIASVEMDFFLLDMERNAMMAITSMAMVVLQTVRRQLPLAPLHVILSNGPVLDVECEQAVLLLIRSLVFLTRARHFVCVKLDTGVLGLL